MMNLIGRKVSYVNNHVCYKGIVVSANTKCGIVIIESNSFPYAICKSINSIRVIG